jgi:hypothetical protein
MLLIDCSVCSLTRPASGAGKRADPGASASRDYGIDPGGCQSENWSRTEIPTVGAAWFPGATSGVKSTDFADKRAAYYDALALPADADTLSAQGNPSGAWGGPGRSKACRETLDRRTLQMRR